MELNTWLLLGLEPAAAFGRNLHRLSHGSPVFQLQILGLVLHNHVGQFLTKNLLIYVYMYICVCIYLLPVLFLWRTLTDTVIYVLPSLQKYIMQKL